MAAEKPVVPGIREQLATSAVFFTTHVQSTVKDPVAREALVAEVKKHVEELAALTKDHLTDADKRNALLEHAKAFSNQAVTAVKDPNQRASLLDKLKATAGVLQEVVKDPAKRQELHDQLAATTHKLLTTAQEGVAAAPCDQVRVLRHHPAAQQMCLPHS